MVASPAAMKMHCYTDRTQAHEWASTVRRPVYLKNDRYFIPADDVEEQYLKVSGAVLDYDPCPIKAPPQVATEQEPIPGLVAFKREPAPRKATTPQGRSWDSDIAPARVRRIYEEYRRGTSELVIIRRYHVRPDELEKIIEIAAAEGKVA